MQEGGTVTSGNKTRSNDIITPGTYLAVNVKLELSVWKVINHTRFITRGILELLADKIAMAAWLSQLKQILLLAQRGAQIMQLDK